MDRRHLALIFSLVLVFPVCPRDDDHSPTTTSPPSPTDPPDPDVNRAIDEARFELGYARRHGAISARRGEDMAWMYIRRVLSPWTVQEAIDRHREVECAQRAVDERPTIPTGMALAEKWERHGAFLDDLGEPSIACPDPDHDLRFRLIVEPSFRPTIVVRGTCKDTSCLLTVRRFSCEVVLFNPVKLACSSLGQEVVEVPRQALDGFDRFISRIGYWRMPAESEVMHGLDGSDWSLEIDDGGRYRFVGRWSPSFEDESLAAFGDLAL